MDFDTSQPVSEQSTSQAHRQELVAPNILPSMLKKRPRRDSEDVQEDSSTSRSHTDNADIHDMTDSFQQAMQDSLKPFHTESGNSSSMDSNIKRTSKKRRIQADGPHSTTIKDESSRLYLRLNDCDDADNYKLEMDEFLPPLGQNDNKREKYLFNWTEDADTPVPKARFLSVLKYYVALDTSTSPPKGLKIVAKRPIDNGTGLVYRLCRGDSPAQELWLLYFVYEGKCYQIKVENGLPTVEQQESPNKLNQTYVWNAML